MSLSLENCLTTQTLGEIFFKVGGRRQWFQRLPTFFSRSLSSSPPSDGPPHLCLLELFAFGTYAQYLSDRVPSSLPELTKQMQKKLRLLTVASMATSSRVLEYSHLREELGLSSVRELEDLIIEGANANVIHGKLDQQSLHFEVDYAMPRDIRKVRLFVLKWCVRKATAIRYNLLQSEVNNVIQTLEDWCTSCDGMLKCLESQAGRANTVKAATLEHKKQIEQKVRIPSLAHHQNWVLAFYSPYIRYTNHSFQVGEIRGQLKQSQSSSDGCCDDPDSRMDTEGPRREAKKVAGKAKGQRGGDSRKAAGGGGGGGGFWPK